MKLQQNLSVKQQLSQNMVQAASILQMGAQELKEYLQEFAVENPVVDLEQLSLAGNQDLKKEKERRYFEIADTQNRVYYREDRKEEQNYDLSEESEEALQDYFLEQLLYLKVGKEEHRILEYMIFSLDDRGYFVDNMEEICDDLWITLEKGEQMRQILCSMEPKGVGAVSLKECLLLQIDSKEDSALLQMEIIENYLELFGKNQMREIARKTGK